MIKLKAEVLLPFLFDYLLSSHPRPPRPLGKALPTLTGTRAGAGESSGVLTALRPATRFPVGGSAVYLLGSIKSSRDPLASQRCFYLTRNITEG